MKGNAGFEELVRYLDTDLKDVLEDQQREHVYALALRATASVQESTRKAMEDERQKERIAEKAIHAGLQPPHLFEKPEGPPCRTIREDIPLRHLIAAIIGAGLIVAIITIGVVASQ